MNKKDKNRCNSLLELKLKSELAPYISRFAKNPDFYQNKFTWNVLKGEFDSFDKKNIQIVWNTFQKIRNYTFHYQHKPVLDSIKKSFDLIFEHIELIHLFENNTINLLIKKLFDLQNRETNSNESFQAKWLIVLFYCSLFLYRSEFNNLKNRFVNLTKHLKDSFIKNYLDKLDQIIKLDKSPRLEQIEEDKTIWMINSLKTPLSPLLYPIVDEQLVANSNKTLLDFPTFAKINFSWIITFWEKFLLEKQFRTQYEIELKLKQMYFCKNTETAISKLKKLNVKDIKEWPRILRDQFFCYFHRNCQSKDLFYFKDQPDYLIKNNVFYFKVRGILFKIAFKTAKHLLLHILLKNQIQNKNNHCKNVKKQFESFLLKCLENNSDISLFDKFLNSGTVNRDNENKLKLFKNRTFVRKYLLIDDPNTKQCFNFKKWKDSDKFLFEKFWQDRKHVQIQKWKQKLEQAQNYRDIGSDKHDHFKYLPFKTLIKRINRGPIKYKRLYLNEVRLRLSFVFKMINSVFFVDKKLDKIDFNNLFERAFQHLFKDNFNFDVIKLIEKTVFDSSTKQFDNYSKIIQNIRAYFSDSFVLETFDSCFVKLIKKKIDLTEGVYVNLNEETFRFSVLKERKEGEKTSHTIKINYPWLQSFLFSSKNNPKSPPTTLIDLFNSLKLDTKLIDFYRLCATNEKNSTPFLGIDEKFFQNKRNLSLKLSIALKFVLIEYFRHYFLDLFNLRNKQQKLQFSLKENFETINNFFSAPIQYLVDSNKRIFITFPNYTKFRLDLLDAYKLTKIDKNQQQKKNLQILLDENPEKKLFKFEQLQQRFNWPLSDDKIWISYSVLFKWILQFERWQLKKQPTLAKILKKKDYVSFEEITKNHPNKLKLNKLRNAIVHRDFLNKEQKEFAKLFFKWNIEKWNKKKNSKG